MPRYSKTNNCSVKFELPSDLRTKFQAACDYMEISQGEALRIFIREWTAEVEQDYIAEIQPEKEAG